MELAISSGLSGVKLVNDNLVERTQVAIGLHTDSTDILIKYKGEKFDIRDTKNDISLKLIEGLASKIEYSFNENDEYENVVEIRME